MVKNDLKEIKARLAAATEPLHPDARLRAYYYGFRRTGVAAVDAILSAVAVAGKGAHSTMDWTDTDDYGYYDDRPGLPPNPTGWDDKIESEGGSAISLIKRTAMASADTVRTLAVDLAALIAEVERLTRLWKTAMRSVASLRADNERLQAVVEAAEVLSAEAVTDPGWPRLKAALDAWRGGA